MIGLSCYLVVSDWDPWQSRRTVQTSDMASTAFQPFLTSENICTPFEFKKLTAIFEPMRWGERPGLTTVTIVIEIHGTYAD